MECKSALEQILLGTWSWKHYRQYNSIAGNRVYTIWRIISRELNVWWRGMKSSWGRWRNGVWKMRDLIICVHYQILEWLILDKQNWENKPWFSVHLMD